MCVSERKGVYLYTFSYIGVYTLDNIDDEQELFVIEKSVRTWASSRIFGGYYLINQKYVS